MITSGRRRLRGHSASARSAEPVAREFTLIVSVVVALVSAGVVWLSVVWGRRLQGRLPEVKLGAAPLVGEWRWRPSWRLLPAALFAALFIAFGPGVMRRARFWVAVAAASLSGALFALLLAAADGTNAILAPVVHPTEYWDNLDVMPPTNVLLRWFSTRDFLVNYSVHLKGHPPGFILLLKGLAAVGLGRPWVAGTLSFLGIALLCGGVAVAVRTVAGEATARAAMPFLVIAPFAVWLGTSADAFYSGVFAIGVALVAVGSRGVGWTALLASVGGGTVLGGALMLTYGAATLLPLPVVVLLTATRTPLVARLRRGAAVAGGAAIVLVVFWWAGFSWFDGLRTTRGLYWEGTAKFRLWTYFLLGNIGALIIALGPVMPVALARLRDRRIWLIVLPTLVCIALADASQYSKGEVERIWLLFMPWIVIGAAPLRRPRVWMALQAIAALVLQAWLVSKW